MWLAPFAPFSGNTDRSNCIYVFLDDPVSISRVVVYNYTKTPSRGVSEIEMLVDDVLVYRGTLRKAQSEVEARRDQNKSNDDDGGRSNSNPGGGKIQCPNNANAILFTADKQVIRQALQRGHVFNPSEDDDDSHCLFFNHGQQIQDASAAGHAMRPTTSARSTRRVGRGVHKSIQDNVGDLKTTKSKRLQPL